MESSFSLQSGKFSVYVGIVGIKLKSANAFAYPAPGEPLHLVPVKENKVFFGPVHG
jgi:hypothetical protein